MNFFMTVSLGLNIRIEVKGYVLHRKRTPTKILKKRIVTKIRYTNTTGNVKKSTKNSNPKHSKNLDTKYQE